MWPTPNSALYLRNQLRSHFLSDGDAISRCTHRLLKFPFLSGNTRRSVFPLVNSPLFAGVYLSSWVCSASWAGQTRAVNLNLQQNIQCLMLAVHADKLGLRDHLGELLPGLEELLGSGNADLTVPDHVLTVLAGVSPSARRELLTEESLENSMQPWVLEMHFSLEALYHPNSDLSEISVPVVGFLRWKYSERC